MTIVTYQYRIKDSTSKKKLKSMANSVNQVWNYCNETAFNVLKNQNKFLTGFDLNKLTTGVAADLGLNSDTVNAVCEEYAIRRKQYKKQRLKWRSSRKSLGWIPFKGRTTKYLGSGEFKYLKHTFKFWESRPPGTIKCGSFCEDSKGNWFLNLVCEIEDDNTNFNTKKEVGVDLGLKALATYSDGTSFAGSKFTRKYADQLAKAQRAKKKKLARSIHKKIANSRKDELHKETTRLIKEYDLIVVGDVSSSAIMKKNNMAKSVHDMSWYTYKTLLAYKAIRLGKVVKVVNEAWTSKTCHVCDVVADFGGLSGLSVREWTCKHCNTVHDRDTNAAINILRLGH